MSSRAVKGVCVFNSQWLTDDEFKLWIARSNCETEFRCIYCKVNLSLGNMGVKALRSHATRSKTHVSLARLRTETLQIEKVTSESERAAPVEQVNTIEHASEQPRGRAMVNDDTRTAEQMAALKFLDALKKTDK